VAGEIGNVRLVILFLGVATLIIIGGGVWLAHDGKNIPDALIGLGGTSLGALGAMLSKTSSGPQDVQVVNQQKDPVPVENPAE
jgi:hypothetical protein